MSNEKQGFEAREIVLQDVTYIKAVEAMFCSHVVSTRA